MNKVTENINIRLGELRADVERVARKLNESEASVVRKCVAYALPVIERNMDRMKADFAALNSASGNPGKAVSPPASALELDARVAQVTTRSEAKSNKRKPKADAQN
jgi:hypothetical protein